MLRDLIVFSELGSIKLSSAINLIDVLPLLTVKMLLFRASCRGFLGVSPPDIVLARARAGRGIPFSDPLTSHLLNTFHPILSQEAVHGFGLTSADLRPHSVRTLSLGSSTHPKPQVCSGLCASCTSSATV